MVSLLLAVIYLAFISLGLPDAMLGAAWPTIYPQLGLPVSYAGIISMIIAFGTVISSLMSDRLTHALGAGKVTAISVGMTAFALFGFSFSHAFWMLALFAIPYGLGAGSVDAALNNYVALHYSSRHMSWLHCMWGIGATLGPYIMSLALTYMNSWNMGYRIVGLLQVVLTAVILFSLPLWKKSSEAPGMETEEAQEAAGALPLREVIRIPGAKEIMLCFFCYSAVEQTSMLWAGSYLTLVKGLSAQTAAGFAGMFCLGIAIGRFFNGFLTVKFSDTRLIRMGMVLIAGGIVFLLLPAGAWMALVGFVLIGLGCAPIYPCIIHSTPAHFGVRRSQAMVGVQMASAYIGTTLMPPLFGLIANHISAALLPLYLTVVLVVMAVMHTLLEKKTMEESC